LQPVAKQRLSHHAGLNHFAGAMVTTAPDKPA